VDLPLRAGTGTGEYTRNYRENVETIGRSFDPQLVLVSAGFDAHRGDPLAGMALTAAGYAELLDVCLGLAEGAGRGRVVVALEGGYLLPALAQAGAVVVRALLGERPQPLAAASSPSIDALVDGYRRVLKSFWPSL
jgi:acetoin utilization deacetylase AcuC-like enzyme